MGFVGQVWRLTGAAGAIGEVVVEEADFPWLRGRFTAGPAFGSVRGLFERELALADDEDRDAWERVWDDIARAVTLHAPHGPVAEFLLHIEDDRAWFRWSDEPVDGGPAAAPADGGPGDGRG
ncbi:hypothetical protein AB0E88_15350 [Streptomyces sp. NPDC028635]|uniref:hypothetical protein n=1 Tax=Streptomyces sp. NPDC028635 TaxID=3154800 RepID=UPI003400E935